MTGCGPGLSCCGSLCTVPHQNGEGETYTDCADATGTPLNAATYNENMAQLAAEAYPFSNPSFWIFTCSTETAFAICNPAGTTCYAAWCYTGACAGYVLIEAGGHAAYCPNGASGQTWN